MIFLVLILIIIGIFFAVDYIFFNDIDTQVNTNKTHIEQKINSKQKEKGVEEFLKNMQK